MKKFIIVHSLCFLLTEPKGTLSFKMFDFILLQIEFYYSIISIFIIYKISNNFLQK